MFSRSFFWPTRLSLRVLALLCLAAVLAGIGINRAAAKPNRNSAKASRPTQMASVGTARGKGNVYEGYTLVSGVRIMMPPHAVPGGIVEGHLSVSGSGSDVVTVTLSGPGVSATSFSLAPGQSTTFTATVPTQVGSVATYSARTAGSQVRAGVTSGTRRTGTTTVTIAKKQWSATPAPAPLRLLARSVGAPAGHSIGEGNWSYAPGARVRVFVDQEEVEGVVDNDSWTLGTESGQEADQLSYSWSSAQGTGALTPLPNAEGDGNGQEFTLPTQIGATITVSVTVTDRATLDPATEDGSRSDGPQTFTLTLISQEQGGPRTGGGGGGIGGGAGGGPGGGVGGGEGGGETDACPADMHRDANGDCVPNDPDDAIPGDGCPARQHKNSAGECVDDVYTFTFKQTNSNPETMNDSLEAVRGQATSFDVYVTSSSGAPVSGKTITLTAQLGTVTPATLTTDGGGRGRVEGNTGDDICRFTSDGTAGWGQVRAEMEGERGTKNILCHRVRVNDFSQPKLLRYDPDSDDGELSNPTLDFSIADVPSVGQTFSVTCTIYSLSGHAPLARRTWSDLRAGSHSKSWSDFFFSSGPVPDDGRALDPGEGIYPFDVQVSCTAMNVEQLNQRGIANTSATGSDWKASQSLKIKPRPQNAWSLSYDEEGGQTTLAYIVDIENNQDNPTPPQEVRIDVYDPALTLVGSVTQQNIEHTTSQDGRTFTYYFNGPVEIESAGDYHFVVVAQNATDDPTAQVENKDAGKWAVEQNSSAAIPSYVVFGGNSPGLVVAGRRYGQASDYSEAASTLATSLRNMSYRGAYTAHRRWWMQNQSGIETGARTINQIVAEYKGAIPNQTGGWRFSDVQKQTIQYHAVWAAFGHGANGRVMAFWTGAQTAANREYSDFQDENWEFLIPEQNQASTQLGVVGNDPSRYYPLDQLPRVKSRVQTRGGQTWPEINQGLPYLRAAFFFGCETGANSQTSSDLPSQAVQSGAKVALGFTTMVDSNQVEQYVNTFSDRLRRGDTVSQANARAAGRVGGAENTQISGSSNIRLSPAAWGDNVGPDR